MLLDGVIDDKEQRLPSATTIKEEISMVSAQLNLALKRWGVGTPPTDADLASVLALMGCREVCYQITVVRGAVKDAKQPPEYLKWHEEFQAVITAEKIPPLIASADQDGSLPWSSTMDADETDPSDPKNPTFTKDYVP